ncbi:FGGY-family carbohydrate kinase [Arthrobacter psychrolactophilus]
MASDTSHSLKSAIDVEFGQWDRQLLESLALPVEKLGVLVHPGSTIGEVSVHVAQELGLPAGISIIAGMTDGCTAQIGAGAVLEGDVVGVLGTTLVLKSVATANICTDDFVIYSHRGPDGNFWPGGASNVGAGALSSRFGTSRKSILAGNEMAQHHGVASSICYPLNGVGERFPFRSATARFFAVGGDDSDAERYRAIMEGVAYTERLGVDRLKSMGVAPQRFLTTGGGSSSALWNTIRATVLGQPVHKPQTHNSAFGAAMIAGAVVTGEQLSQISTRIVSIEESFEPDLQQSAAMEENYHRFLGELDRRGYLEATQ